MFGIFKSDPIKKLQKEYEKVSAQAIEAQRNGNIELFGELSQKADELGKEIDKLQSGSD
ncbi:MAG: DUF6435 family protein [Halobacteriovoraceae bacterium]|nr:DUF6435 family protein [Halobacteriovoraceae bacterium]